MAYTNPAAEHFARVRAKRIAEAAAKTEKQSARERTAALLNPRGIKTPVVAEGDEQHEPDSPFELKFWNDFQRVKSTQSTEQKVELKRDLLPAYAEWVKGIIADGVSVGNENTMLLWLMIWSVDVHDFELATAIAEFALINDLTMPEPFKRDVQSVFVEQVSEEIINEKLDVDISVLDNIVELTNGLDMLDPIRAKLYKARGRLLEKQNINEALAAYKRAYELDKKSGVKTVIGQLQKAIKKQSEAN